MFITAIATALSSSIEGVTGYINDTAKTFASLSFKRIKSGSYEKISLSKDKTKIQNDFKVIGNDMKSSVKKYSSNRGTLKYE